MPDAGYPMPDMNQSTHFCTECHKVSGIGHQASAINRRPFTNKEPTLVRANREEVERWRSARSYWTFWHARSAKVISISMRPKMDLFVMRVSSFTKSETISPSCSLMKQNRSVSDQPERNVFREAAFGPLIHGWGAGRVAGSGKEIPPNQCHPPRL